MIMPLVTQLLAAENGLTKIINYPIVQGNSIWRFFLVLLVILLMMAAGRTAQYLINAFADRKEKIAGKTAATLLLRCLTKPVSVAFFALGLYICKLCLVFENPEAIPPIQGISLAIEAGWIKITKAVTAIAAAYAVYRFVDVIEYYLLRLTSKTKTKLDDMLVPIVRKSMRVTIAIISILWIADGILEAKIRAILLSAGVGGIAIALAAKDTIANFFGSITIFADRPFQIDEMIKVGDHIGPVEEVGFRSTKIRTLAGHLVTIPNSEIANTKVENIGSRPFIRRTANITITYDSGRKKTQKAVQIIKDALAEVPEINTDPGKMPRVYFSDFNDWALNIYMTYWVKPPDYWIYHEVNEKINFEIMKKFEKEKIEFAFPSQTLYLKKDES